MDFVYCRRDDAAIRACSISPVWLVDDVPRLMSAVNSPSKVTASRINQRALPHSLLFDMFQSIIIVLIMIASFSDVCKPR